ncbi:hypothetical protein ACFPFX_25250 [Streptomyces mauvecolor]|uniref:Transposase n=1 Tax=Streptomyces mauvecolor TaxID=58345 RepID=A0ABV9UTA3_9ACTN
MQVPARKATERDESRNAAWKDKRWPVMKRGRRTWAPGSASRGRGRLGLEAAQGPLLGPPWPHTGREGHRRGHETCLAGCADLHEGRP